MGFLGSSLWRWGELFRRRAGRSLILVKRGTIVGKNAFAFAVKILELTAVERPREHAEDAEHEQGRQRDQQIEDVHRLGSVNAMGGLAPEAGRPYLASRNELATTTSELVAMPIPAAQGGSQPASASGTQARL